MNLTPEQQALGRRNFLRALAGTPALAAFGAAAATRGPVKGGPVRLGYVGLGRQGRVLLEQTDAGYAEVRALCDINPTSLKKSDAVLAEKKLPAARHYAEWKEMLAKEDLEGVVVAAPLWQHAEIVAGCLEAGKHVLCEKMMAYDVAGCELMRDTARKTSRLLEIGYQRCYNPVYHAAFNGIIKAGKLGEIYHARLVWHRNQDWRRKDDLPSPDYDPSKWGYPTFDHLVNWRLYNRYSKGLYAELASHQVNVANWFFESVPEHVQSSGSLARFKENREVYDHVYSTFEYPGGRTATFSSIESNAFDHYYEMFLGTKGTLILRGEIEHYLFDANDDLVEAGGGAPGGPKATAVDVAVKDRAAPALDASESRTAEAAGGAAGLGTATSAVPSVFERVASYRLQMSGFCSAIRVGTKLNCGPDKAMESAKACIAANEAVEKKTRLRV
jgi:predicted dehydrogenase